MGRMVVEKGIKVLAAALKLSPYSITTIGDGPENEVLRSLQCVEFLGLVTRTEVVERMRKAEYLVMPSIWYETFGMVMIEAFACRLPVIASNIGVMAELVKEGKTGLLFEAGSASDLSQKLEWANAHPERMRKMGDAARSEYEQSYNSEENYKMLIALYEKAIAIKNSQRMIMK